MEGRINHTEKTRGIYFIKKSGKYRVRKFDVHIGCYNTYEEALEASEKAQEEHEKEFYLEQYLNARDWLRNKGLLN